MPRPELLLLTQVIGNAGDAALSECLHELAHRGALEHLEIAERDALRRRLRARTDRDNECAIALPRDQHLHDGDVLLLTEDRAIVVRVGRQAWLRITPRDGDVALRLGYHAGNLHWRVRFDGGGLLVAIDGARQTYLDRLAEFIDDGEIEVDA